MTGTEGIAIYSFSESEWDSLVLHVQLYCTTTDLRGLQHAARVQELLLCVHKATRNLRKIRGSKCRTAYFCCKYIYVVIKL